MKKLFAGTLILSIITVALFAMIVFRSKTTPVLPVPQIAPVSPAEKAIATVAAPLPNVEPSLPAALPAAPVELPTEQGNTPEPALEPLETQEAPQISSVAPPPDTLPHQEAPPAAPSERQPSALIGLLTDTGETEENQMVDPYYAQVKRAIRKQPVAEPQQKPVAQALVKENNSMEMVHLPGGSYPFSILLETLNKHSNAQQAITLYKKKGVTCYWVKVSLDDEGDKYRLFTGAFSTEAEAKNALAKHHLSGKYIKKTPYAARIGIFSNKEELAATFRKTAATGAVPYVLGTADENFFLFVGAFYTAEGANTQCRELVDKGLPCQAVSRSTLP
jgi:hypothetical protein